MFLDGPRLEMRYINESTDEEVNLEIHLAGERIYPVLNAMVAMLRAMSFPDVLIEHAIGTTYFEG